MGVIDNGEAAVELAARWAYRLQEGEIVLERCYDRISASVAVKGQRILELGLRDPTPLRASDAYYVANMNLAQTPNGLRLIQVDPEFEVRRAERGPPWIELFDAWGPSRCRAFATSAALTFWRFRAPSAWTSRRRRGGGDEHDAGGDRPVPR